MKGRKVITVLIIINLILVGIIYNLINRVNVNNKKQIIKEMTEIEYENYITELNKSHTDYANYIEESKAKIASVITKEGVSTLSDDTFEIMTTNIGNIFNERTKLDESIAATADDIVEGKKAYVNGELVNGTLSSTKGVLYYLGEVNASTTFDISKIPGYENLTLDNFIGNVSATHCKYRTDTGQEYRTTTVSTSMSYDAAKGVLTVSCPQNSTVGDGVDYSRLKKIQMKVYVYTGQLENI